MEVDARMTWEAEGADGGDRSLLSEIRSWRLLFHREYISRSLIGIMVMVFQRKRVLIPFSFVGDTDSFRRMEWYQRAALLWSYTFRQNGSCWRYRFTGWIGIYQYRTVSSRGTCYIVYRPSR
jgi:hypothetical protein